MVDINDLLPRERTPLDYLNLVDDPRADQEALQALARNPYSFVRRAVAQCPRAGAATLAAIDLNDLDRWTRNSMLAAIARHANADRPVLLTILRETRARLDQPDQRPFAAALALARRPELTAGEILELTRRPYASRRMAGGVLRILARDRA